MQNKVINKLWAEIKDIIGDGYIEDLAEIGNTESLDKLYEKYCELAVISSHAEKPELFYLAGYVAYIHPSKSIYKAKSARCFIQSLLYKSDYLPAILYLVHLEIDSNNFQSALQLLCSFDVEKLDLYPKQKIYFSEVKILSFIKCSFWHYALDELSKFDKYLEEDKYCGIDLYNLINLIDSIEPKQGIEKEVMDKISSITSYAF